uniref:Uncharacterized protein n=1 Tax=Geospiza parvula TaxID=87175 RepID=A0A8C3NP68_GEOPR
MLIFHVFAIYSIGQLTGQKVADKAQKKYWKWKHSPKNEDDYVVTSDAELDAKSCEKICANLQKLFDIKKKRKEIKI